MSVRDSLKSLVAACGGESTAKSVKGILGELSVALGGSSEGKTLVDMIDNITDAKNADNPLNALTLDFNIGSDTDLLGKVVADLQEDAAVDSTGKVTGTSHYVTGYTGFSSKVSEQSGNYFAFHFSVPDVTGATIKVNGVTLDADGIIVLILKGTTKPVTAVVSKQGYGTITKKYNISSIVKEPESQEQAES